MKKITVVLLVLLLAAGFVFAGAQTEAAPAAAKTLKVGLLCIGDENDQGYSYNFIQGQKEATEKLAKDGINVEWVIKYNIGEDSTCTDANIEAAEEGCQIIFNNSYGFEPFMLEVAPKYPNVKFVSCTNCVSCVDKLDNTFNAFANIYEGRYVAGVVAGLKLNELISSGKITADKAIIGYVGAYSFAEVISGFTSYYLGAKSVCPSVTMMVSFVGSWSDATAESDAALSLADKGAVIISQHSDNTTPATAAQSKGIFHTGYNADMTGVAPAASLISTRIDWSVYFYEFIKAHVEGVTMAQDWCKGFSDGAVVVTTLNEKIAAPGTKAKMEETIEAIKAGKINVFDTSTFTVGGKVLTHAFALDTNGDFVADSQEAVFDGVYHESLFQSAPYFTEQIDGITWLNVAY
ncbi:MAG: BMP family ABC transporter substrate-binding protein [Sphaerochaetaceae bacterium]|jgi:basic membrane protein A